MNGIVIVDKPEGFTSHDVVAKLRGIYQTRRIGHSGTLDPMATGVLPIFIGRATRAVEFATGHDKTYQARLLLGIETDSQDITGRVLRACEVKISDRELLAAINSQIGEIEQIPPMFSAVKIGGKRLYQLARQGVEIERPARKITIYSIAVHRLDEHIVDLTVRCSKGTYIRTLCADIGAALGCGGTLAALRRIEAGKFFIKDAKTFDEIQQNPMAMLHPVDSMFTEYPMLIIDDKAAAQVRNGALVNTDARMGETYRVYDKNGAFLMLAEVITKGKGMYLKTIKSFFEV